MAYSKSFYHIDEVAEIFRKHGDNFASRESVLDLGARGILKIGLLTEPFLERGKDLVSCSRLNDYGYSLEVISTFPTNFYQSLARAIYDSLNKDFINRDDGSEELAQLHQCNVEIFLEVYRYSKPLLKKYRAQFGESPILVKSIESGILNDWEYDPLLDEVGLFRKPEKLIFPVGSDIANNKWILRFMHGDVRYYGNSRFVTTEGESLLAIKTPNINIDEDDLCEDCDSVSLIYSFVENNDYLKELLRQDRLYISRKELMRFEQTHLGIDNGLEQLPTPDEVTSKDGGSHGLDDYNKSRELSDDDLMKTVNIFKELRHQGHQKTYAKGFTAQELGFKSQNTITKRLKRAAEKGFIQESDI